MSNFIRIWAKTTKDQDKISLNELKWTTTFSARIFTKLNRSGALSGDVLHRISPKPVNKYANYGGGINLGPYVKYDRDCADFHDTLDDVL